MMETVISIPLLAGNSGQTFAGRQMLLPSGFAGVRWSAS
jgi:hypothetical protein